MGRLTITKRLALTVTALLPLAFSAPASADGPSFDCATLAQNKPLAQLICADPRLPAIDVEVRQRFPYPSLCPADRCLYEGPPA